MMDLKGKDLDDFFRKELSNGNIPFDNSNWLKLEKRLKKNKHRNRVLWLSLSGIAALLLITLSVSKIFFADEKIQPIAKTIKEQPQLTTHNALPSPEATQDSTKTLKEQVKTITDPTNFPALSSRGYAVRNTNKEVADKRLKTVSPAQPNMQFHAGANENTFNKPVTSSPAESPQSTGGEVMASNGSIDLKPEKETLSEPTDQPFRSASAFSVSFLAGPDINGVNTLKSNRGGISVGLMLNYKFSKKLSVSTGAFYAKKLYNTQFEYYKPNSSYVFPTPPKLVSADCRVLDIPLNINFTALSESKDAVALSAGVSSYIMLNEGYSYTYETPATRGPRTYYIANRNRHYMGILNFAASYERKISDEVSIGLQPYVKIPVTDIGYGNVKLLSTGVLTSVKLNILSKNK